MADLLTDKGPPKKEEPPEPKGGKAPPITWAQRLKIRQYRTAMRFAGYAIGEEVTEKEFKQACDAFKKVPGNWYLNPDKYLKKKKVVK
ncbi:unnamed protein product [marine sediment metagenome]|uniref:Uncharacterized protein n=1 Tax=marine sediment metagenome TaxID=412755 RepID=X0UA45_9ZZZZ